MPEPVSALSLQVHRSDESIEEQGWIARVRAGDADAFKALYDRYSDPMFAFAYSCLGSRDEAQDAVHDVFFSILKSGAEWSVERELRTYLLRSVYNRVATLRRHLRVEISVHESIVRDADSPLEWAYRGRTDDPLLQRELGEALARAVLTLPPRAQQAYRLVREHGLPYAEAGTRERGEHTRERRSESSILPDPDIELSACDDRGRRSCCTD